MSEFLQTCLFVLVLVTTCLASQVIEERLIHEKDKPRPLAVRHLPLRQNELLSPK